jgi:RNA polymerase subunit RPABC4/transcription elongation factor Spt4
MMRCDFEIVLGVKSKINFAIMYTCMEGFQCHAMVWDHRTREIMDRKPCEICSETLFSDLWLIVIVIDPSKVDELDSLMGTCHHTEIVNYMIRIDDDADLFTCLSDCRLSEKLCMFYFSSWKCPKIGPRIDSSRTSHEENMRSMLTDDMGACRYECTRHE